MPKVGRLVAATTNLLLPDEAAAISTVPVMAKPLATVSVTAELEAEPRMIFDPVPLTVQAASVVALFNIK